MTEALESRSQALTDTMSSRVMDIARTLAEGGKEVVDRARQAHRRHHQHHQHARIAPRRDDRHQGRRDRPHARQPRAGSRRHARRPHREIRGAACRPRGEGLAERSRRAPAPPPACSTTRNEAIKHLDRESRTHADDGVRRRQRSAQGQCRRRGTHAAWRQRGSHALLRRQGRRDLHRRHRARGGNDPHPRHSSSTLLSSLTSKSQEFTADVGRATQEAVSAIEAKGFDFTRTMLDNSGELSRLINEAGEAASGKVNETLLSLHASARDAIEKTQVTTSAAVSEMIETHNMLRTDTVSLFERLREANILLQEVMSGSQENMDRLETALTSRVSEFASVMNDVSTRTGDATNRVSDQVESLPGHHLQGGRRPRQSRNAVRHAWPRAGAGGRTDRHEQPQGRHLDRRAPRQSRLADQHPRHQERGTRSAPEALLGPARRVAGKLHRPRPRYRPHDRGDVARKARRPSSSSSSSCATAPSRSASAPRTRCRASTNRRWAIPMPCSASRPSASPTCSRASRRWPPKCRTELDATRAELRKGIMEMPAETAETTAQMRRVIVDQIEALAELNRIVARHGGRMETAEPRRAAGAGADRDRRRTFVRRPSRPAPRPRHAANAGSVGIVGAAAAAARAASAPRAGQ